jgi:probable F420-dependent oxidoreductase
VSSAASAASAPHLGVAVSLTDQDAGIVEVAVAVEEVGLESLFLTEHSHVPVSRRDLLEDPFHARHRRLLDQFTALGAAAAVTSRLRLGTSVCVVPQHDPIQLAKQVATIDHISAGRFLFGVAAGWLHEELRNLGVEPSQRWDLMDEHLAAMKEIWTHEEAEFHGSLVDFEPLWMWPKPVQAPYPPVLVGGMGPRSLRLVAEHGDGWLPVIEDADELETGLTTLRRLCDERSRPMPEVTVCLDDLDKDLLLACGRHPVARIVVMAPTDDLAELRSFLTTVAALRHHLS